MADVKTICVRLNLSKPVHKKAYELLKSQTEFPSYSSAIATAVADYFDFQERENRLIEKFIDALSWANVSLVHVAKNAVLEPEQSEEDLIADIDFDFCGG